MKKIFIYVISVIALIIIGFLIQGYIVDMSYSQLDKGNVQIVANSVSGQFKSHLIFALSIGIIPLLYLVSKKFSKIKSINQIITTFRIILGS